MPPFLFDKGGENEDAELKAKGYSVQQVLGEGSYAKVKYAEKDKKKFAVKIINLRKAAKDFQVKFLPRELDIIKKLNHPNIVQCYEIVQTKEKVYIVMELAGHGDLLEYIKIHGRIEEGKARLMFRQLVAALEYLHTNKICHRDLKCENLLLDSANNIKISDFGFARIYTRDPSKTFCGSAAYAAPEVLRGIPYQPMLYDVWSTGVILYIMVCGSMPFDDHHIRKMIEDQLNRRISFPKSKKLSAPVIDVVRKMLEPNTTDRIHLEEIKNHEWLKDTKYVLFQRKEKTDKDKKKDDEKKEDEQPTEKKE